MNIFIFFSVAQKNKKKNYFLRRKIIKSWGLCNRIAFSSPSFFFLLSSSNVVSLFTLYWCFFYSEIFYIHTFFIHFVVYLIVSFYVSVSAMIMERNEVKCEMWNDGMKMLEKKIFYCWIKIKGSLFPLHGAFSIFLHFFLSSFFM